MQRFPLPPPPALDTPEYTAAFNEMKSMGARTNSLRSADQTQIGLYWAYDRGGMGAPPILYNQMVRVVAEQQGNTLAENARLFALVNLAQADAAIVCWAVKYQYNFWRPITALQAGDDDGNPATMGDANWLPLGAPGSGVRPDFTPPFPSYPSGHGTFGAAVFRLLERFYGRDDISFTCGSDELPGVNRSFRSFSQADEENALSRVYLGVHWIFDQRAGQASGRAIADYIFLNALRPIPSAPQLSAPHRLPDGSFALHLSAPHDLPCLLKASEDLKTWRVVGNQQAPFTLIDPPRTEGMRFYSAEAEQ